MTDVLSVSKLRAGYGETVILEDVDFTLPEQGSLAVLGRSLGEPFTPLRKTAPLATPFAPEHESASVSSSGNAGPAR